MKKIVVVGATSAIAESCIRLWAKIEPANFILVGRDVKRLERVAADNHIRSPQSTTQIMQAQFLNADSIKDTVEAIACQGKIDIVLIAHGYLPNQIDCQNDLNACHNALELNAVSPVLYAKEFARHMAQADHGTIAIISSVAGDRGRKSNYVYGAAKGLVTRYTQGLQHRFAGTGVTVVAIKPGPTETPMTSHLKAKGAKLASPEEVARQITHAIACGARTVYTPKRWQFIMLIIRHLPTRIFNRLNL